MTEDEADAWAAALWRDSEAGLLLREQQLLRLRGQAPVARDMSIHRS